MKTDYDSKSSLHIEILFLIKIIFFIEKIFKFSVIQSNLFSISKTIITFLTKKKILNFYFQPIIIKNLKQLKKKNKTIFSEFKYKY